MRRRAFVPETSARLEPRALLSNSAGVAPDRVYLSESQFNNILTQVRADFQQYANSRDFSRLQDQLKQDVRNVPYARPFRLGATIHGILDQMRRDTASRSPGAIAVASRNVVGAIRAEVEAGMKEGSIEFI